MNVAEKYRILNNLLGDFAWNHGPVFCFTADIDWASEDVLEVFLDITASFGATPTLFLTHESGKLEEAYKNGSIERGIHPNFLPGSSHGDSFREVADNCRKLAPETICYRTHRFFEVTDTSHLLANEYGMKYSSNYGTILQTHVRPQFHESGLINFPVFFEDGTHLYNQMGLDMASIKPFLSSPGIKIISMHPMNMVFNSPDIGFMRKIKDSLSRDAYNNINRKSILEWRNNRRGIGDLVREIAEFAGKYPVMTLNELYHSVIH